MALSLDYRSMYVGSMALGPDYQYNLDKNNILTDFTVGVPNQFSLLKACFISLFYVLTIGADILIFPQYNKMVNGVTPLIVATDAKSMKCIKLLVKVLYII